MANKGLLARSRGGKKAKKPRPLTSVKSGIGLSSLDKQVSLPGTLQDVKPVEPESFITSRTARVLLAGAGFLADAYDLFVINLVLRLLREEYPEYGNSGMLHAYEGSVASAALFGSILGQIVAGSLADIIGRKKIFVATALLISVGSIGSSLAVNNSTMTGGMSIYGCISIWRFLLGAGVGGEYPLAATVTSESSSAGRRGSIMAAVFAMQGVGALISVLVVLLCLKFGLSAGFTWRFALAFGAVPAAIAFPYRLRMHETETFERVKQERRDAAATVTPNTSYGSIASLAGSASINDRDKSNDSKVTQPLNNLALATSKSRYDEIKYAFLYYKWHMLGTALSWFLLDVDFYANGIFNHDVTSLVLSHGRKTTAVEDAWNSALLCCIGVPGYWLSILYLEKVGRKNVQINGFVIMGVLFFICGIGHDWFLSAEGIAAGRQWIFLLIYSLTFLFSNFGPNTTTFVIPGEIYPAEVRATCHGLSAACGKLGAATGAYFFPMILGPGGASNPTSAGLRQCMFICSFIAVLGAVVTHLFIPRYDGSDLETEDNYLLLEHNCLIPSAEDLELLRLGREARAAPYTMLEIIDTSHNYSMDYLDTYNAADVLDENGALKSTKSTRKEFSTIDNLGLELVSQEL